MMRDALNPREKLFADTYIKLRNGAKSVKIAGYQGNGAALRVEANRLLKKRKIKTYIDAVIAKQDSKVLCKIEIERDEIINTLHQLINDAVELKEIKAAVSAIAELNKMRGNYAPAKAEVISFDGDKDLEHVNKVRAEAEAKLKLKHQKEF
jgi:phage terminase small subunit